MNTSSPLEESLARAFEIAYFIHGDKTTALIISAEAMAKLEVAATAQYKRLYYTLTGRDGGERSRTKVSVSELHLLQRLVYVESEPHERRAEQASLPFTPDEEDMLIYFIKHLVQITTKRNSFYVTLGLGRLLHNYSTAETMEIYNVVVQDAGRVHDDYYYRSRKGRLMKELKERFGDRLRVVRGPRGEERFQTDDSPNRHAELVRECLMIFTPWDTHCVITAGIDPFAEEIAALGFSGADPDEEHAIEVNRFHAMLHPDCFARLMASLNFAPPDQRLASPCFFMNKDEEDNQNRRPPWHTRRHPRLDQKELEAIKNRLGEQSLRRKSAAAGLLRVLVDGRERARLDLNRASRLRFPVGDGDELIEVRLAEEEGDLLLATHLIDHTEAKRSRQTSIILEEGQKLSFTVASLEDARGEPSGATVDFSYRETKLTRAAALALRQLNFALLDLRRIRSLPSRPMLRPALAFTLLAILAIGFTFYWRAREHRRQSEIVKKERTTPTPYIQPSLQTSPIPSPALPAPRNEQESQGRQPIFANRPSHRQPRHQEQPQEPVLPNETNLTVEETRGKRTTVADGATLAAVKMVHVDSLGEEPLAKQIRDSLIASLQASSRLTVTLDRDNADAVLRGKLATPRGNQVSLTIRLLNIKGAVLWPIKGPLSGKQYQGDANVIADKIVNDLLADIQKAERK
ncbi:MAG TPA: hypothetical protein VJS64_02880 [Pyrinomonadaceae bacterium]|nr:hypothetical protein [Pyrinomonadaceae bacterium]